MPSTEFTAIFSESRLRRTLCSDSNSDKVSSIENFKRVIKRAKFGILDPPNSCSNIDHIFLLSRV